MSSGSGSAGGGGYSLQARMIALVGVHILSSEPLAWLEMEECQDIPCAVSAETGGPGDDFRIELLDTDFVFEVQAKRGLSADRRFDETIDHFVSGLRQNSRTHCILAIDPTASIPIRTHLLDDLDRLRQGREDNLHPITKNVLHSIAAHGADSAQELAKRISIHIFDIEHQPANERLYALLLLKRILANPTQAESVWSVLCDDAMKLIQHRGRRNAQTLTQLLRSKYIRLAFSQEDLASRQVYLEHIYRHYATITFPLSSEEGCSLKRVFQPLALHTFASTSRALEQKKVQGHSQESQSSSSDRLSPSFSFQKEILMIQAENGDDALQKSSGGRLVILGEAGMGKTTMLKYFVHYKAENALSNPTAPIPIFFSLAEFARSGKTLQDYLKYIAKDMGIESEHSEMLWKALKGKKAFLCLDSFDEIEPKHKKRIIDLINTWAEDEGNTWIIGSRVAEYKEGQFTRGNFIEWELQPMNVHHQQDFVSKIVPELQRLFGRSTELTYTSSEFVHLLKEHPHPVDWRENPLLFSLVAAVFIRTGKIPSSHALLYGQAVDVFLEMREADSFTREVLLDILSYVALELHQRKQHIFTQNDVLSFLRAIRHQQQEQWPLNEMAHRLIHSGLFTTTIHSTYSFRHQTFQEYLVAAELARRVTSWDAGDQENAWQLAWKKRTINRWVEVLRLFVGVLIHKHQQRGEEKAETWLRQLIKQRELPDGDPGDFGLVLAMKSLSEIGKRELNSWMSSTLEIEIVSVWLNILLEGARHKHLKYDRQQRYLDLASEVAHYSLTTCSFVLERLTAALNDDDQYVCEIAVRALGKIGEPPCAEPLGVTLFQGRNYEVRLVAAEVLNDLPLLIPVEPLIKLVEDDEMGEELRAWGVTLLGKHGEHAPISLIVALAAYHFDEELIAAAASALGHLGARVPLSPLIQILHRDYDLSFPRSSAARTLRKMGNRVPLEVLYEFVRDRDIDVRTSMVEALGNYSEPVSANVLLQALGDPFEKVRKKTIESLETKNITVPIEVFLNLMVAPQKRQRVFAIRALGSLKEKRAIQPLLALLSEEDTQVLREVVDSLLEIGEEVPVSSICHLIHHNDIGIRQTIIKLLGYSKQQTSIEFMQLALLDSHPAVREAATYELLKAAVHWSEEEAICSTILKENHDAFHMALSLLEVIATHISANFLQENLPVNVMKEILDEKDDSIRKQGIRILEYWSADIAIPLLLFALHDKASQVRVTAVNVLGKFTNMVTVEPFIEALSDNASAVQDASEDVLWRYGPQVPTDVLLERYDDKWYSILKEWHATKLLDTLEEDLPVQPLIKSISSENGVVRKSAVRILKHLVEKEQIAVDLLLELLNSESDQVRRDAAWLLGYTKHRISLDPLMKALYDTNNNVRAAALKSLGDLGISPPTDILNQALSDTGSTMRIAAIYTLGQLGQREYLNILLSALHDENAEVRSAVVRSLGTLGLLSTNHLLEALHDKESSVQTVAVEILEEGRLPNLTGLLIDMLDDHNWMDQNDATYYSCQPAVLTRETILYLLGQQGKDAPVDLLISYLRNKDSETWLREAAIKALHNLGKYTPVEPLIEAALHDEWDGVRRAASASLKSRCEKVSVQALVDTLRKSTDWQLRLAIAELLREVQPVVPLAVFIELLSDKSWAIRRTAVEALGRERNHLYLSPLLRASQDNDESVRQAAAQSLGKLGMEEGVKPLLELLNDGFQEVRGAAASALVVLGLKVPLELVIPWLRQNDSKVQVCMLQIMKEHGSQAPVDILLEALGNSDGSVRQTALDVLKETHPDALLSVFHEAHEILLKHSSGFVLGSIQQSLLAEEIGNVKFPSPYFIEILIKLLHWPYWEVRMKALKALGKVQYSLSDETLQQLRELLYDSQSQSVRDAAEEALATILSRET